MVFNLIQCFALENLLFLERAVILYHEIEKYRLIHRLNDEDEDTLQNEEEDERFRAEAYQLGFEFLPEIYKDIDNIIESSEKDCKQGIYIVMKSIYQQFGSSSSEMEINVSSECQSELRGLFECLSEEEFLQRLTLEDMKGVYHSAITQCYQLCFAVYSYVILVLFHCAVCPVICTCFCILGVMTDFQFRHYVSRHTKHTPRPSLESMSTPLTPPNDTSPQVIHDRLSSI